MASAAFKAAVSANTVASHDMSHVLWLNMNTRTQPVPNKLSQLTLLCVSCRVSPCAACLTPLQSHGCKAAAPTW
jgi:hypothetical protein